MYRTVNITDQAHDEFVERHPNGDLLQLTGWATSKRLTGWYSRRIAIQDQNQTLVAVASLLFKKLPKINATLCYISRGFVCDYNDESLVRACLEAAIEIAKLERAYVIKIDPDVELNGNQHVVETLRSLGFKHRGYPDGMSKENIQPRQTMVTDITKDEDILLKSFENRNRTKVRKSLKRGTTVKRARREDLPIFVSLMKETGQRDGFLTRDISYFEAIYDSLNPHGQIELFLVELEPNALIEQLTTDIAKVEKEIEKLKLKSAKKNVDGPLKNLYNQLNALNNQLDESKEVKEKHPSGVYLSGALLALSGHKAYYLYGASSNLYRDFLPNHHMQFEMMKYAKRQGAKTYDFGGVKVNPDEDSPYIGLWKFKKGWGTEVSEKIGEFDYVLNKPIYKLAERAVPMIQNMKVKINKKMKKEG